MLRKIYLVMVICILAFIILFIFSAWQQIGLALLPLDMGFC